jgi:hypothetical protein
VALMSPLKPQKLAISKPSFATKSNPKSRPYGFFTGCSRSSRKAYRNRKRLQPKTERPTAIATLNRQRHCEYMGSRASLDCGKRHECSGVEGSLSGAEQAMGSEILRVEQETAATSSAEVEFALVLSRMIDSVKSDPEHLRATVYELARHKLKEQFGSDKNTDMRQLSKSLEIAIQGVETFVAKNDRMEAWLGRPGPRATTAAGTRRGVGASGGRIASSRPHH